MKQKDFLHVGPGGINCACCFPGSRKARKQEFRAAKKRLKAALARLEAKESNLDSQKLK